MKGRPMNVGLEKLLVLQVSGLVDATVDAIKYDNPWLATANLYRMLASNCEEKAKMAEGFAEFGKGAAR
jgi:hypothetical protein